MSANISVNKCLNIGIGGQSNIGNWQISVKNFWKYRYRFQKI